MKRMQPLSTFRRSPEYITGASIRDAPFAPELVVVQSGSFRIGSDHIPAPLYADEAPARDVSIDRAFAVGRFPVTFAEFWAFSHDAPPDSPIHEFVQEFARHPERLPVVMVSWYDAVAYCEWLSDLTRDKYRLLTELEWEYACRAGTTGSYWWGESFDASRANSKRASINIYSFNAPRTFDDARKDMHYLTPVDKYGANPWGLFDMLGNTWEWVSSVYTDPQLNPVAAIPKPTSEPFRVNRGGSWMDPPLSLRCAARSWALPSSRDRIIGFRVAREL